MIPDSPKDEHRHGMSAGWRKIMKICVVGLGSISKRHIKNIYRLYPDAEIDVLRHKKNADDRTADDAGERVTEYGREVYSANVLKDKYDAVFITNPTTMHVSTLKMLADKSDAFFIEKPLRPIRHDDRHVISGVGAETADAAALPSDMADMALREDMDMIAGLPGGKIYYVACPMRYTQIVKWLKDNIDISGVYSIRAMSSSYLPEWRPGTDYSECYSARRSLGGGVATDLIHEWDYISYLFGRPEKIISVERRLSDLDIDVEDIAVYIGEYERRIAEVHLDYFGRSTRRSLELYMADDTVICDFIENRITYLKSGRTVEFDEERDDYQTAELTHFFDIVSGRIANDSSASEAEELLELIEG